MSPAAPAVADGDQPNSDLGKPAQELTAAVAADDDTLGASNGNPARSSIAETHAQSSPLTGDPNRAYGNTAAEPSIQQQQLQSSAQQEPGSNGQQQQQQQQQQQISVPWTTDLVSKGDAHYLAEQHAKSRQGPEWSHGSQGKHLNILVNV